MNTLFSHNADNETDCRENAALKKASADVVNDLFDSRDLLIIVLPPKRA
ncbi:hypothetical protein B194_1761 [Serratia plymuthica A30]|jgi:hypothetical protein|nr:hypothetical protein B194_1761 [Serratia plymuthica A30]